MEITIVRITNIQEEDLPKIQKLVGTELRGAETQQAALVPARSQALALPPAQESVVQPGPHAADGIKLTHGSDGTIYLGKQDVERYGITEVVARPGGSVSDISMHEAGHAVIRYLMNGKVDSVTIEGRQPITYGTMPGNLGPFEDAIVAAAGGAVGALCGTEMREGGTDTQRIEEYCRQVGRHPNDARKAAAMMLGNVKALTAVFAVAQELDRYPTMQGEHVERQMEAAGFVVRR